MAARLPHDRNRTVGLAGALAVHGLAIGLLLLLRGPEAPRPSAGPSLIAVPLREPPPPPVPEVADEALEQAPAPASRGADEAPSPPEPPIALVPPTPAEPSVDPGSGRGSGTGDAAGSGTGSGGTGQGGGGAATPPVRLAGALTDADYRRTRPPEGAAGTVVVGYRIRTDGRVDRCAVLRSSGYAELDEATCRLIERRFRFEPARDAGGRAIDWQVRTDYTWRPR
jgi:protein TonB